MKLLRTVDRPEQQYTLAYLGYGFQMGRSRSGGAARRLLKGWVIYLPLLFILLAVDRSYAA